MPAFREPSWKNARTTLVIMGCTLGAMFLGLSVLAAHVHPNVYKSETPTVISQIGRLVYGPGALGNVLFYGLQAGTMLILVLAANTSFADFPRLASFHAEDNFMPRQLTKRGHRLVFSNGIIFLAVASIAVLIVTDAKVDRLIPLYAIGVFTSFTLSQAGMAKHHLTHREPHWHYGLFVNGTGAFLSFVVDVIIAITKFTGGAWFIIVLVPVMVAGLVRLNRQYEAELEELKEDAPRAAEARVMRRHAVIVLIDQLDVAAARAIQYARALTPDDLRAVHFDLDPIKTEDLTNAWRSLGFSRLPLDIVECTDRRIAARRRRVGCHRARRRRHRGQRVAAAPRVHALLAPVPARPHRRLDRAGALPAAAQQRHDRPVPPRLARRSQSRPGDERARAQAGERDAKNNGRRGRHHER